MKKIKLKPKFPRSPLAVAAKHRKSAIFDHKNEPKGGAINKQKEILEELEDEKQIADDNCEDCDDDF